MEDTIRKPTKDWSVVRFVGQNPAAYIAQCQRALLLRGPTSVQPYHKLGKEKTMCHMSVTLCTMFHTPDLIPRVLRMMRRNTAWL